MVASVLWSKVVVISVVKCSRLIESVEIVSIGCVVSILDDITTSLLIVVEKILTSVVFISLKSVVVVVVDEDVTALDVSLEGNNLYKIFEILIF